MLEGHRHTKCSGEGVFGAGASAPPCSVLTKKQNSGSDKKKEGFKGTRKHHEAPVPRRSPRFLIWCWEEPFCSQRCHSRHSPAADCTTETPSPGSKFGLKSVCVGLATLSEWEGAAGKGRAAGREVGALNRREREDALRFFRAKPGGQGGIYCSLRHCCCSSLCF